MRRDAYETLLERLEELDGPVKVTAENVNDLKSLWEEAHGRYTTIPEPEVGQMIEKVDLIILLDLAKNNERHF